MSYPRERWTASASYDSVLSSSTGATPSTRNEVTLNVQRLLRWNNWYYAGVADFLQSSVQGIQLQTSIGGGIGRYLKNNDHVVISVLGGLARQRINYQQKVLPSTTQNAAAGLIGSEVKLFISTKPIFRSAPIYSQLSRNQAACISTSTLRITSSCGASSPGTFRSMATGTIVRPWASPAATTVPVPGVSWRFGNQ